MHEYCLNLVCKPAVEEPLLDLLREVDDVETFTSFSTHHYGADATRLSAEEQVLGRSRSIHLQLLLDEPAMTRLLARIAKSLSGTGIRYWATRVAFEGEIK